MNRLTTFLIPIISCILTPVAALAADPFETVVETIVANSPELKSARLLAASEKADLADANALANPEVEFARVWGAHSIGNKLSIDVSQSFDWPGAYRARSRAAKAANSAADMLVASKEVEIALEARLKLIDIVYLRHSIAAVEDICARLSRMEQDVARGYNDGVLTILDLKKVQFEGYRYSGTAADLRSRLATACSELEAMCPGVDLPLDGIDAYPIARLLSAEEYVAIMESSDPLLASYAASSAASMGQARAATLARFPGFSVGYRHEAEQGDRYNGFTVGLTLPFFQGRNARRAALARADEASLSEQTLRARRCADIAADVAEAQLWKRRIEEFNAVFGDGSYLSLVRQAYDGGQMNAIEYCTEVNYYYDIALSNLDAERAYHSALARLNRY